MSKPRPPTPPDPQQVASAQTGTNVSTAVANTAMGQVNQITPDASLTYSATGNYTWTDPSTGQTYSVPQYTATTTLSPEAQAIREQNNAAALNLATLAANQSGRADQLLSTPFSLAGLPPGADRSGFTPATYGASLAGPQFSQGGAPLPQASTAGQMPGMTAAGQLPGLSDQSVMPGMTTAGQMPGLSAAAMVPGASQGTAGPQFGQVGTSANLLDTYSPEGGFSSDRQRVEDALMGRLNTQRDRDMERLRTQLLNQGVNIGSEAYSRAMQDFDRSQIDQRTAAILGAGQEQSRLLGEARAGAGFTNEARQAGFQNQLAGTGFNNAAALQGYQLAEDQRRYADAMGLQRFGLGEDVRRYDDAQRMQQFGMGEDIRRYQDAQGLQRYGLNEDARRYQDAQRMQQFGLGEDIRRYQDAQGLQRFGLGEDIRRYDDAQRLGLFGLGEDQRRYADAMAQQGFANQQAIQGREDMIADARFGQQASIYDALDNARLRELQTQLALRNQPINEITALMSGSQVATPQFNIAQSAMIPTTDYAGIRQQGFQNQMANYQQQNANYQALMGGLFGLGSSAITGGFDAGLFGGTSDIRLKTDIVPLGKRKGHNWYSFRYVWDEPGTKREGVMAQEVLKTRPDAVITHPLGFYMVDYDALGLAMETVAA